MLFKPMSRQTDFLDSVSRHAIAACRDTALFPSVCIAQAILETGWGKSTPGNNLFGMKATGNPNVNWDGSFVACTTYEYINGVKTRVVSKFRKYKSYEDSFRDHNRLFLFSKRYISVLSAKTPEEQAKAIKNCGYATDPSYAEKLINLIIKYNLKQYDKS